MISKEEGQFTIWKAIIKEYPRYDEDGTEECIIEAAGKDSLLCRLHDEFCYEISMLMLTDDEKETACRQRRIQLIREAIMDLFNCPIE